MTIANTLSQLSLTDVRNVEDTLKRLKLPRKFHTVTDVIIYFLSLMTVHDLKKR